MHLLPDPATPPAPLITFEQFLAVDIRVGRIVSAVAFPEARKPAIKLLIDFGPTGRLVAAVVNFPPRQIGKFLSEVLTLGFPDANGAVVLFAPDEAVPLGARLF
jgi:tRNA-binding protein